MSKTTRVSDITAFLMSKTHANIYCNISLKEKVQIILEQNGKFKCPN